jgi:hypothetical protein
VGIELEDIELAGIVLAGIVLVGIVLVGIEQVGIELGLGSAERVQIELLLNFCLGREHR